MISGYGRSRTAILPNITMQLSAIGCPVHFMSYTLLATFRYRAPCIPAVPKLAVSDILRIFAADSNN